MITGLQKHDLGQEKKGDKHLGMIYSSSWIEIVYILLVMVRLDIDSEGVLCIWDLAYDTTDSWGMMVGIA